jgi:two-component system sporulation sensor kinase B
MEITKHLFLNLSILIILLLFCLIWLDRSRTLPFSKTIIIIISVLLLWICLQFAYSPVPYARYDLRIIPIVIGGLYLGIGLILVAGLIIIRSLYGLDSGLVGTILLYVPLAIVFFRLSPWFWKQSSERRIYTAICLGMILGVLSTGGELLKDTGSPFRLNISKKV